MGVRLAEAIEIRGLLRRNTEELTGVMRALNGEYILPEAGGDLLRDGPGVLPTGGFSREWQIELHPTRLLNHHTGQASTLF